MASSPITSWQIDGEDWKLANFIFGSKITADSDCSHEIKKMVAPWKKSYDQPRQHIEKQRRHFSSSHVWMWELDPKEGWAPKNWYFGIVVLEKILESPLDSKEINPVNPKGTQSWIFTGRTDTEAEAPILWPSDVKRWLTGKDPDAGKHWGQVKGVTEDEMVGWYHQLSGHEFEQTPRDGEGHGSPAVHRVAKSRTQLSNWTILKIDKSYPHCSKI